MKQHILLNSIAIHSSHEIRLTLADMQLLERQCFLSALTSFVLLAIIEHKFYYNFSGG